MRTLLLVVALPALASPLAAQAPSVSLGNAVIYLGMSEDSVTDILAEFGYTTLTVSGSPEGGVVVRTPEDELVGAIGFDNSDNVDTIRRYWGPDNDQDAFPMAVAITEALMSIAGPPKATVCEPATA